MNCLRVFAILWGWCLRVKKVILILTLFTAGYSMAVFSKYPNNVNTFSFVASAATFLPVRWRTAQRFFQMPPMEAGYYVISLLISSFLKTSLFLFANTGKKSPLRVLEAPHIVNPDHVPYSFCMVRFFNSDLHC